MLLFYKKYPLYTHKPLHFEKAFTCREKSVDK